ncbi:hypothetical protein E2562_035729 [Oryza meyeriana var. granulata]|uniref:Uncharacterized protein n=1 Tax=Oryza meyeriana var. granulata TaxID=110450 RepID=A0A6G1E654_9ORYZ|nr:hypothetical protein E2562_035729 [Oryza meyeriana var. granulata]
MGSCVSKKAARAGAVAKEAAPLPPEKEVSLPPPAVVEEEVKEVLSETAVSVSRPRPPEPEKEVVKRRLERKEEEEASEGASVASAAAEKAKAKCGGEREGEQKAVVGGMEKGRARMRTPEQRRPKEAGNGRTRSPSPASAQRRQGAGDHPALPPRPRREQPTVVSGIGCRSGRFSPSAARRAAESAVRRTNSAREADMMLPSHSSRTPAAKRSLNATVNGNGNAYGGGAAKRDPGERSGRRPDSPTSKRIPPASPAANGAIHRQASLNGGATRKTAKETTTLEQTKPQCRTPEEARDGPDESALEDGREHDKEAGADGGRLGQNPSVAMECFIFL